MRVKEIYYWSPFTSKVATIDAVINSAESINKYSKDYKPIIINSIGEFNEYKEILSKNGIEIINLFKNNIFKMLPKKNFLLSRFTYLIIFVLSFFPLLILIKRNKPDFFISHLITSLPLILFFFNLNKTKHILRISGLPKMTLFRKLLWKISAKKLFKIFCPTKGTMNYLIQNKIFPKEKINLLRDPVINITKINQMKKNDYKDENFFVCIGRLTKQKNFSIVVDNFKEILQIDNHIKLYIIGDGEHYKLLKNKIYKNNLEKNIFLIGYKENVFKYLKNARFFLLSSLWEDPGWVLIEAAASNTPIISSDCKNGPQEFLGDNLGGILFRNNDSVSLINAIKSFYNLSKEEILKKKIFAKKKSKNFTSFSHYVNFEKLLS